MMNAAAWVPAAAGLAACVILVIRLCRQERAAVRTALCIAAGLVLYYLVRGFVERRLVPGLLLPVSEGALVPGRPGTLLLCEALCLALAATGAGRRLSDGLTALGGRAWGRWLCAAGLTGLFFLWSLRVNVLCYMTMDDVTILHAIAAVPREGLEAVSGTWSNILLCALLGRLYAIAPNGYWYLAYHLTVLLSSLVILGRCLLLKAHRAGLPAAAGCAAHLLLCLGLFTYTLGGLSFTLTPAAAGAAAVALTLCREDTDSLPALIAADLGGALLLFLCRLQRYSTMQAVICFWGLAVAYSLVKLLLRRDRGRLRSAASLAAGVILSLFLCFADLTAGLPQASADYQNAEYYRSVVMDYLMDNLTDEQWAEAGIPPELAVMMRGWYFMDERVNTETFRALTERYYETGGGAQTGANVMGTNSDEETGALLRRSVAPVTAGLVLAAALAVTETLRRGKRRWPELLCALCALGGAVLLWLYLLREGRFPLRVYLVVAIPAAVTMALMLPALWDREARPGRGLRAVSAVLCAALCLTTGAAAMGSPRAETAVTRAELFAVQHSMEDYARAHEDITFYTNMTDVTLDPVHGAYTYPENISVWGGSFFTTDDDHPCADAFFREDVRLIVKPLSSLIAFLQYLTLDNGPVEAVLEERLADGVSVVRIRRAGPEEPGFTGWYERSGFTYYYENGQPAEGRRIIGGTAYDFTPAGRASAMATLRTEDGVQIYTTDAFALITP